MKVIIIASFTAKVLMTSTKSCSISVFARIWCEGA